MKYKICSRARTNTQHASRSTTAENLQPVRMRGGQLEFWNGEPWELALDHVAQHRIVRLRAGSRILQLVAEVLRGARQMDQNEADTIDGKVETHFAVTAHRGTRDRVERILAELAELRIGES